MGTKADADAVLRAQRPPVGVLSRRLEALPGWPHDEQLRERLPGLRLHDLMQLLDRAAAAASSTA